MLWALEEEYFRWLCAKVMHPVPNPTPSLTHWKLLQILHRIEFVWLISGDDNRVADGLELRDDFIFESRTMYPRHSVKSIAGCSVLEMLIAFSYRTEFMTDIGFRTWFWRFLENLGLCELNDAADIDPADVEEILDRFIWRTYEHNGKGGLFPLTRPHTDQRDVEVWYQFAEYLRGQ